MDGVNIRVEKTIREIEGTAVSIERDGEEPILLRKDKGGAVTLKVENSTISTGAKFSEIKADKIDVLLEALKSL